VALFTTLLGLAIDALLAAGSIAYLVEAAHAAPAADAAPAARADRSVTKPSGRSAPSARQPRPTSARDRRPAAGTTRPATPAAPVAPAAPAAQPGRFTQDVTGDPLAAAMPGAVILFLALAAHAVLTLLALRARGRVERQVLLGRLAVVCWLVLGGVAAAMGAHLWPASLTANENGLTSLVALTLAGLGGLLAYLGGLEWQAQRVPGKGK
jgi:hypothetical protein